jgi:hypothetical protein
MTFNIYKNNKARNILMNLVDKIDKNEVENKTIIMSSLNDFSEKFCFTLSIDDIICSFAILNKMDFDPNKYHNNPYMLHLIFTFPKFRRQNHAFQLINYILENNYQITSFPDSPESEKLFRKLKFKEFNIGIGFPLFKSVNDKTINKKNIKKIKPNQLCPCMSGKKYKKCCR